MTSSYAGPPKFAKVVGREEVAQVVQGGHNVGDVHCYGLYFPSTGEVVSYATAKITRVDKDGNPD